MALQTTADPQNINALARLRAAELAGRICVSAGWTERPTRVDLAAGLRPPEPNVTERVPGELQQG
eukprot:7050149-Pyramimonas_sp.AAC.1